jgi:hypothetical protein
MAASVTHLFVNPKGDGPDTTIVQPGDWNDQHVVTGVALTGKQAIPVPAGAMTPNTTNGAASGTVETTTNKNMFVTLDFDSTTSESAQFSMPMPKSWDEGTITFIPYWSHPATTTNFGVVFELSAVAVSNDDPGDVAFGTGQTSIDTGGTTDDIYVVAVLSTSTSATIALTTASRSTRCARRRC